MHGVADLPADFTPCARETRLRCGCMAIIGKRNLLAVVREAAPGLYLDGGVLGEILLPRRYIPYKEFPTEESESRA